MYGVPAPYNGAMLKFIRLKLVKIQYSGDSIGDDIRVETQVLGKFLRVDKRIKVGMVVEVNSEIGRFETDRGSFQADVFITVVEKDVLFNDVGNMKGILKVNTSIAKPQQFIFKVEIKETRSILGKFWGKRTAVFEITLEAEVADGMKYVPDLDESQGFLEVWLDNDKSKEESLPACLKLKIEQIDAKREYFTILEGPYRGRSASVQRKSDSSSWFISDIKHEPMARATYSISEKTFILKGKKYKTTDYPEMPWEKGLYDIEIADYPHGDGRGYLTQSKRAITWFRIGHKGERYLHAGGYSLGCMTVIEVNRWMEIYDTLIKARKGDFMSVGVLEVVD